MVTSRTPSGVRGLKLYAFRSNGSVEESHPVRGAWIEIVQQKLRVCRLQVAPRQGCVD